jgi:hypothetical protein
LSTNSHLPDPELQQRLNNLPPSMVEKNSTVFVSIPEHGYGTRYVSVTFLFVCLFVFLALQPIVVVFSQPGSGL